MRDNKLQKRAVTPDPIYQNRLITKIINQIMRDGKKTVAQSNVYGALELINKQGQDPMQVFEKALQNVGPKMEVRPRRVGGASYQVPAEVRGDRKVSLAIRWIVAAAQGRPGKEYHTFKQKLAAELLDAAQNQGAAIKKRDAILRMAEANRAFSHFRW